MTNLATGAPAKPAAAAAATCDGPAACMLLVTVDLS